ncbi:glycoside hydrolase family 76 protein [Tsukamurella sp. 8F]|uniref:glycoside hydrolase family 76 protein n=1 Tax=unclassified Tsukamurella TaxID=2633480 RepID=UPI0023B938CF|nr:MULTISPECIES: glycoside hydrolase family 76 protein [unclassified Tsukamurella]MDF0530971.1 glycoside hydrolase family 76 protein [Tsukamurella sp. 8J]MDF0588296.1 glycoside hydrolase family 76 protein [Tsukamurella sp. 8F]
MAVTGVESVWAQRAAAAQEAVTERHIRRLWHIPTTALGVCAYPPTRRDRMFASWNFWWQAHLIDAVVDAHVRTGSAETAALVHRLIRGHLVRNGFHVANQYYDDMAWLALALERAQRLVGIDTDAAQRKLSVEFMRAWVPEVGGGIPWRRSDVFLNAPANGPAAIFLARSGNRPRAREMSEWLQSRLVDADTGLIDDGVDPNLPDGSPGKLHPEKYTYCQGVVIGLETELSADGDSRHAERVGSLVQAVAEHLSHDGVVQGAGGGDGGLFAGILLRYLAFAATSLDGDGHVHDEVRAAARDLVLASAEAAWKGSRTVDGHVLFSADWSRDAVVPGQGGGRARFVGGAVTSSDTPERDMSVQVSGWMAMEAAWSVSR